MGNNAQAAEAHRNEEVGSVSSSLGSTTESFSSPALKWLVIVEQYALKWDSRESIRLCT